MKKQLQLKPIVFKNESTQRIYDMTKETCERFNSYYLDFFESIAIMEEKKEKYLEKGKKKEIDEIEQNIEYMNGKIDELSSFMEEISKKMEELIELSDIKS